MLPLEGRCLPANRDEFVKALTLGLERVLVCRRAGQSSLPQVPDIRLWRSYSSTLRMQL